MSLTCWNRRFHCKVSIGNDGEDLEFEPRTRWSLERAYPLLGSARADIMVSRGSKPFDSNSFFTQNGIYYLNS